MMVIEYFQKYQIKDSLKWERLNLPNSKRHLVKCVFPVEFGSKEFVPNKTWNSVCIFLLLLLMYCVNSFFRLRRQNIIVLFLLCMRFIRHRY